MLQLLKGREEGGRRDEGTGRREEIRGRR